MPLTEAPSVVRPPRHGPYDAPESRKLRLVVVAGDKEIALAGWCRVGVWTTLGEARARTFVVRRSWGRLGNRRPRELARIEDQAIEGVVARLRPEPGGGLSFDVEVADVHLASGETVGIYHGQRITFRRPRRHGYRFRGTAPPGHRGWIGRWPGAAAVALGDRPADGRAPEFGTAEAFVEEWVLAEPVHVVADGVERMDYRLVRKRRSGAGAPGP